MAGHDPDNHIKLFRMDDSQDSTYPENVVVIPAGQSINKLMFRSEFRGWQTAEMETGSASLSEEGINFLIKFRHELEELFLDCGDISGIAAVLWEDISRRLFERGFTISAKQCAAKWESLYSEYLEIVQSDDEGRVSGYKHFSVFEKLYKLRSKFIDSKIVEDITEYLSFRSECPSTSHQTGSAVGLWKHEKIEASMSKKGLSREDFSTLSSEDNSQILIENISAAQKILENNLKDLDNQMNEGTAQNVGNMKGERNEVEKSLWGYKKKEESAAGKETSLFPEEDKNPLKTEIRGQSTEKKIQDTSLGCQLFVRSDKNDFYWDSDSTQCFLDLRLYVETNKETKQSVLRIYKSIVKFLSQKMLQNGFAVSEIDCRKKWDQLLRYYNREIHKIKMRPEKPNPLQEVKTYFWLMDRVLKKSGLETGEGNSHDFIWDERSIKKLISIRMPMANAFSMFKRYVILWQYVASQMQKYNYSPTYNECSIKWMEMCEIYKICLDSVRRGGATEQGIAWNFYKDMRQGFEDNASIETVFNYNSDVGTGGQTSVEREREEKTSESLASCTFSSSCEAPTEFKLDVLRRIEHFNIEQNLQIGGDQSTLETAVQHCDISESMLKGIDVNAPNNSLSESNPNPSKIDNNMKVIILEDLYSLDSDGILDVKPENSESSYIQGRQTPLLKFEDAFGVKNRFEQSFGDHKVYAGEDGRVEATESDEKQSATKWTDEATSLMIKFKDSRELKFTSSSYLDLELWQEVTTDMESAGYSVSAESCSTRWHELVTACKDNPNLQNCGIISPKNGKKIKMVDLPYMKSTDAVKSPTSNGSSKHHMTYNGGKKVWTDDAIKTLIRLKFGEEIRYMKKYSLAVAKKMQAAGFSMVTPTDVSKKWSNLCGMYKKSLIRKKAGQLVTWQYFTLMDNYMRATTSDKEPEVKKKLPSFSWTPKSVQKLIDVRVMLENYCRGRNRKELKFLWMKVADSMVKAGFQVTHHECAAQWSFLFTAYMKTKQELRTETSAVIGQYFIMIDKALNKLNSHEEDIERPIDFSIGRNKTNRKDNGKESTAADIVKSFGNMSFEENTSSTPSKTVFENEEQDNNLDTIEENVNNLTMKTAVPHLNYIPVDSSSEVTKIPKNRIYASSSADSSPISSLNKENNISLILTPKTDRSQRREVRVSLYTNVVHSGCTQYVLPKKRSYNGEEERLQSPKKMALSVELLGQELFF